MVEPSGPAERAGIKAGDRLLRIQGAPVEQAIDVIQMLFSVKPYLNAKYTVERRGHRVHRHSHRRRAHPGLQPLLSVPDRLGLSRDRIVRIFPPRQRAEIAALPAAVSRQLRSLDVPLHGKAEQLRQGHLLGQYRGRNLRADDFPALLPDVSGAPRLAARPRAGPADLLAGYCFCLPLPLLSAPAICASTSARSKSAGCLTAR